MGCTHRAFLVLLTTQNTFYTTATQVHTLMFHRLTQGRFDLRPGRAGDRTPDPAVDGKPTLPP